MAQIIPSAPARFTQVGADLLPESVTHQEVKKLLDAMNFPCAFLKIGEDGEERIISANEQLTNILGKKESQIREAPFSSIFPNNENSGLMKISNKEWTINRTTRGSQTLFMLIPVAKAKEQVSHGPTDAIDHETGLFTPLFLKYRANADVEACRRYGRKLSVVLFRISFDEANIMPTDNARKKAYADFGKMVSESLRACDSGYRMNEDEVLLYLPDTGQSGSKTVVGRIDYKARKLSKVESPALATATIKEVTVSYFGDEVVSVDQVMKDIYVAIGRKSE
jgi:GGDEF domain-containing protein